MMHSLHISESFFNLHNFIFWHKSADNLTVISSDFAVEYFPKKIVKILKLDKSLSYSYSKIVLNLKDGREMSK